MNFEDLRAGVLISGPLLPEPVEVLVVSPMGDRVKITGAG